MDEKQKNERHRHNAIRRTMFILEKNNYKWISNLGTGSFGAVVELKNRSSQQVIAAKIVLQELITYSEVELWPSLSHDNVVPVIGCRHVPQSGTYVFFMPKYRCSLDDILESSMLHDEMNGFERALAWLGGVLNGILYLHKEKLCHLDLKLPNVLINDSDKAVVTDFGSLTRTDAAANRYASPFIYRPPEAPLLQNGKRIIVDGFKYDIYTIGVLATELFTKQMIWKTKKRRDPGRSWIDTVYPVIFTILEKKQFKKFVNATFLRSDVGSKTVENIRNFIIGCIMINPKNRPTVETLLKHRLFRGSEEFNVKNKDIWVVKAPPNKINFLSLLFIAQAASLRLPPDPSDFLQINKECKNVTNNQEPKANEIDGKHADETFDQIKIIENNQELESNQIHCKDVTEVCDQPYIAANKENQKPNKIDRKYFSDVWDQLEIVENDHQTQSNKFNHKGVNEVFHRLNNDTDNQVLKLNYVDGKDISEVSTELKITESKSNETDCKDFEVLDQKQRLLQKENVMMQRLSPKIKEGLNQPTLDANNQKTNGMDYKGIYEAFDQQKVATNSHKSKYLDEKDVSELFEQGKIVAKNQEPETNEINFKDVNEVSNQQRIIKNSRKPKQNEIDLKCDSKMLDQAKDIANNPEPGLNKMYLTDVSEVFDEAKIDSNNQKPELNDVDNEDDNKTSVLSKIDSNSEEAKPNDIKHDPDVTSTGRQRILEWGRRTKSHVTKIFNRLLRRPKK